MNVDDEIRDRLVSVESGRLSIDEFEEWLVAATWDANTALAADTTWWLAQRADIGDEELRLKLGRLADTVRLGALGNQSAAESTTMVRAVNLTSAQTIRRRFEFAGS